MSNIAQRSNSGFVSVVYSIAIAVVVALSFKQSSLYQVAVRAINNVYDLFYKFFGGGDKVTETGSESTTDKSPQ